MDQRTQVFLLLVFVPSLVLALDQPDVQDVTGLRSLKALWENIPPSWTSSNPCGDDWEGIECTNSHVTSISLASMDLKGTLSGDIEQLSELQILDLSYNKGLTGPLPPAIGSLKKLSSIILVGCSFSGSIPDTIGSLQELVFLSLNSNRFSGCIPTSMGNLSKLYWLDLADNELEGPIPVSSGGEPGLDSLTHCKHFHLGMNKLSGTIPSQLFSSNMRLIHVLFESNQLSGGIPSTLGLVQTLEVVRFDRNMLTGPIPGNLNNLTNVSQLFLSNNKLSGPAPNLSGMNVLHYLDLSNNSFDASDVPTWFPTLQSLTTLMMADTQLQGEIPVALFSLPNLEKVVLRNNQLNGTLDIGTTYSNELKLIDLQNNLIGEFNDRDGEYNVTLILVQNPFCDENGATQRYCRILNPSDASYSTLPNICVPSPCTSDQVSSPNCKCAYPYKGTLIFRAPSFSNLENSSYYKELEKDLMNSFLSHQLHVDSVYLSNSTEDSLSYLRLSLEVFPDGQDRFNRKEVSSIAFLLSNQTFKPHKSFGPFYFIGDDYQHFAEMKVPTESNKSSNVRIIVAAAAGVSVLLFIVLLLGVHGFLQKRRATRTTDQTNPLVQWDANTSRSSIPQLKGARLFSFEELKKYTNNFSEANNVGSGGYGKVYRGTLSTGQLIAIKRAQKQTMHGVIEFKTEVELLSRVHHKNLVSLVGFCYEQGEQMLVYEYVANGTLNDSLSGKSGIKLDWKRRLKVALGTARGLSYLHEHANPPIIHRDVKSTNVLLDDYLNAKVADFGLSKPMDDGEKDHFSTQVKGTMGYLDPEYYMTQQVTEKSDVYSFGVLLLELLTGRKPIERGTYVVREVRMAMDKTKDLYNLHGILDPAIGLGTTLKGLEKFVDLAMRCVEEEGANRPTMSQVVKEIETIEQLAGLEPNSESVSISTSCEKASKASSSGEVFDYSGVFPPSMIQPQ